MEIEDVDGLDVQPTQAGVARLDNVLAAPAVAVRVRADEEAALGGDHDVVTLVAPPASDDRLRPSRCLGGRRLRIDIARVDEPDPALVGVIEQRERLLFVEPATEVVGSQTDPADVES